MRRLVMLAAVGGTLLAVLVAYGGEVAVAHGPTKCVVSPGVKHRGATILGTAGDDLIDCAGVARPHTIFGFAGNDLILGGEGDDALIGGPGTDLYQFDPSAAPQTDTITELPSEGTDRLEFSNLDASDPVTVTMGDGANPIASHTNRTITMADAAQDANIEGVFGGDGDDMITGNAADNFLSGLGGNDTLTGAGGTDICDGGAGTDTTPDTSCETEIGIEV